MATRPPHFSMPDHLPGRLLDAGLGPEHLGLVVTAYAESSRNQLDGRLARSRVQSLRGWTRRREMDLRAAGAWIDAGEDVVLAEYLTVNRSRAEIEELREKRAEAGSQGGKASEGARPRRPDGTLIGRNHEAVCPLHGIQWRKGRRGYYCPATAADGEPADRKGYCVQTPGAGVNAPPIVAPSETPSLTPFHAQGAKHGTKQVLGADNDSNDDTNSVVRSIGSDGSSESPSFPPSDGSGEEEWERTEAWLEAKRTGDWSSVCGQCHDALDSRSFHYRDEVNDWNIHLRCRSAYIADSGGSKLVAVNLEDLPF